MTFFTPTSASLRFLVLAFLGSMASLPAHLPALDPITLSSDRASFVLQPSGAPFIPWGFNYDHDEQSRLIEDYWNDEWPKIEQDFTEMKALGANCVRIHLQFARFMNSPIEPNPASLHKLADLLALAERSGLYLDLTGLACYHKQDVPAWYDALDESPRWEAQCVFWRAVAAQCANSPSIFCYNLMNEPVVPGNGDKRDDWLGPPFAGKTFVQFISRDIGSRERPAVARAWIERLSSAIREVDPSHLITVGLVDWSLDRPGLTSGFVPEKIAPALDFLCVHIYPERGKIDDALATLRRFAAAGKPVVVEETFPGKCSTKDLDRFIRESRPAADGWIGFYWGASIEDLESAPKRSISEALTLSWLRYFRDSRP